ncbi:helix-turn-helix domain-containing protein [Pedobacter sp.]|uniref:helix-turn-helix domain-containing protein n=1 Tax=Pedobacter sp. TaxID=1411316 RepID=UPI003D7FD192
MSNKEGKSLGELIKEALKDKGLNQSAVAKKMNVSKQVINQIDRRKSFDLPFLTLLKDVTGIDFTDYYYNSNKIISPKPADLQSIVAEPNVNMYSSNQTVEMSLAIKVKASQQDLDKMGELILGFKREATRLGFTLI